MGHFKLFKKEHFKEKTEICLTCGNYYRRGFLCGKKKIGSNEILLKNEMIIIKDNISLKTITSIKCYCNKKLLNNSVVLSDYILYISGNM